MPTVLFTSTSSDFEGGADRGLLELARALDEVGGECALAIWQNGPLGSHFERIGSTFVLDEKRDDPTSPLVGPAPGAGPIARAFQWLRLAAHSISAERDWLAGVMRQVEPDVIHTNCAFSVPAALAAAELTGVPVVAHIRDDSPQWFHPRITRALRTADAVIAPTEVLARRFRAEEIGVSVIPDPVAGGRLTRRLAEPQRRALRGSVGARNTFAVAVVGRLDEQKGVLDLVEAAEILEQQRETGAFFLAGRGDLRFEIRYLRTIRSAGVEHRVRLLGYRSDVEEWLPAMDALVAPSRGEPFGRVIVEGMLAGIPVVATDDGAGPELIEHERTGLLVPAGDPGAIAAAVRRISADPELAERLGAAGREDALEHFRPETVARQVAAIYKHLLEDR